jgi:uncharacterized membrane protein (DUF2068 family)
MKISHRALIRLIAVFKFFKTAVLLVVGAGILRLMHGNAASVLAHWAGMLRVDPGDRTLDHVLRKAASLPPDKFKELGFGSFAYAALFLTEGIGLWLLKRWAEWFTVVITSSLIPFEVYEIHHRPTILKIVALLLNAAVVAYLVLRIRTESPGHSTKA